MFKRLKSQILLVLVAASLSACAVEKFPVATGGSRADGTVKVSYDVGQFEKPQVHMEIADAQAAHSCAGWGYKGAQAFGGSQTQCEAFNNSGGCMRALVTMTYQCVGSPR